MNYIDLFHGIGGFALGAYWSGMKFENHYCSDIESYLAELYKKRFPDSIQLGNIREIDCEKLMADTEGERCRETGEYKSERNKERSSVCGNWIITGGFPCQDISVAGKGTGIRGSRSGLWYEMWRIIRDLRPRFAIMENVGALTFRGLTDVLGSLAEIGYDAEWQDIRAEDMGAPTDGKESGSWPTPCQTDGSKEKGSRGDLVAKLKGWKKFPTPQARDGDQRGPQAKRFLNPKRSNDLPDAINYLEGTGSLNPTWVDWLMGYPVGWTDLKDSEMQLSLK